MVKTSWLSELYRQLVSYSQAQLKIFLHLKFVTTTKKMLNIILSCVVKIIGILFDKTISLNATIQHIWGACSFYVGPLTTGSVILEVANEQSLHGPQDDIDNNSSWQKCAVSLMSCLLGFKSDFNNHDIE